MNPNTSGLNYTREFPELAQAFGVSEAELLAALLRCFKFLPTAFKRMLAQAIHD